jgi:hypothetical protein
MSLGCCAVDDLDVAGLNPRQESAAQVASNGSVDTQFGRFQITPKAAPADKR